MLSEFCPGSVKGTVCSQVPLCCWLSGDGRGVTGREGGGPVLLPPHPPYSSSLHSVPQSCLLRTGTWTQAGVGGTGSSLGSTR